MCCAPRHVVCFLDTALLDGACWVNVQVEQPGRRRGVLYCPVMSAGASPLVLAVSETLIWRCWDVIRRIDFSKLGGDAGGAQQARLNFSAWMAHDAAA